MNIQCPECKSRYRVNSSEITENGRKAECARCHNIFIARRNVIGDRSKVKGEGWKGEGGREKINPTEKEDIDTLFKRFEEIVENASDEQIENHNEDELSKEKVEGEGPYKYLWEHTDKTAGEKRAAGDEEDIIEEEGHKEKRVPLYDSSIKPEIESDADMEEKFEEETPKSEEITDITSKMTIMESELAGEGYEEEEETAETGRKEPQKKIKHRFAGKGFTDRAGLILIASSLSVILIVLFLFIRYEQKNKLSDLLTNGATLTNLIANSSIRELKKNEQNRLLKIINFIAKEKGLVYGMIMNTNNRIIAHTDSGTIDSTMSDPISLKAASSNNPMKQIYEDTLTGKTIYEFSRPISYNGKKIGVIRLGFTPDAYGLISNDDVRVFAIIALSIFMLVPIFYYMICSSIRPIKVLNTNLEDLIKTKEFKMIQMSGDGEVGMLIEKFNMMISFFKDKYVKLSSLNKELEISNKILSYEKNRVEAILDNINEGIMVANSSRKIILVNKTIENIANINREETIGKDIKECFDHEEVREFISGGISQGNTYVQRNMELTIEKPKGEDIIRIYYMPLLDNRENSIGSLIIVKDLTAQKMAEKAQINFLSSVSHELKSPLTSIKSYTEMLVDGEVNNRDTQIEFYNIINEETYRLERLIENLITISKIEIGSLTINKNILKPIAFLEETAKLMKPHTLSKNIKFETILPDKMSPLSIDKVLVQTAIINLLSNAIKYTPEGGSVTLRAEENDTHTLIHVIDTGYGISEEEIPYIYDKFFRSSREEIKNKPGSGMGLSLAREIISLHDGDIRILSKVDRGTQFTVLLSKEEVVLH